MQDIYNFFLKILSTFNLPITGGWAFALFLLIYVFRKRISAAWNSFLDWMGATFESEYGYRRFDPEYRKYIRDYHLLLKIVGIRIEKERRPKITDAYVPIKLVAEHDSLQHAVSVEQVVRDNVYNLVLGDPGAGKSTILDYLTIEYTKPAPRTKSRLHFLSFLVPFKRRPSSSCPIYLPLRRCLQNNETLLDDILDPTTEILPTAVRKKMPKNFIGRCLDRKRAILLLDGLDEVADEAAYKSAVQKVNDFVQLYPGNKVIVTCRYAGWRGGLHRDFQVFTVLPLDSQQQQDFIHKWYAAIYQYTAYGTPQTKSNIQKHAEEEANELLSLLRVKDRLRELASNPLILSLICLVYKQEQNLPRGRAALYEECLKVLLGHWDREDKALAQKVPTTEQKKLLLRRVAYRMHSNGIKEVDRDILEQWVSEFLPDVGSQIVPAEIVRQIEVRSGLMVERSIDKLTFSHLTFQEFLVVDYFKVEQYENIPLTHITDWSSWREPILLMCGIKNNPNALIQDVYNLQPLLALHCIAEVERVKLNMPVAEQIIAGVIQRVNSNEIELQEAIPALIDLMSIVGNPFGQEVVEFIYRRVKQLTPAEISILIETLSKTSTRESARIILSLITQSHLSNMENVLLSGLGRIGDPAIYEALDWRERDELSEPQIFSVLVTCNTPFSTRTLWDRYKLEPPQGSEVAWAQTWALRLASQDCDQAIREDIVTSGPGITDGMIWPYKENDRSAVAAIVQKVVEIFCGRYDKPIEIYRNIDNLLDISLRVQIPLIIKKLRLFSPTPDENNFINQLHETKSGLIPPISSHAWYTLGIFLNGLRRPRNNFLRITTRYIGIGLEIASILLVTLGIIALLPPHGGNVVEFWQWLPLWAKIGIPIGIVVLGVVLGFMLDDWPSVADFLDDPIDVLIAPGIMLAAVIIFIVAPMTLFYYVIWEDENQTFESMLSLKQGIWLGVLYSLGGSIISAVLGFFAVWHWMSLYHAILSIPATLLLCLLAIFLAASSSAFQKNAMAKWLQKHPRGKEVLDEFARQADPL